MPATNNFNTPRPQGQPQSENTIEDLLAVGRVHLLFDEIEPGKEIVNAPIDDAEAAPRRRLESEQKNAA